MNGRRKFLLGTLGVAAAGAAGVWFARRPILRTLVTMNDNSALGMTPSPAFDGDCVLTSQATDGPFFVRSAMRSDIREDRKGKELSLRLKIANASDCKPIEGAMVEIWHCDAEGAYSGYPEELARDIWGTARFINFSEEHVPPVNESRYLRGAQATDAEGVCEFTTIVPGWYEGRCPHIHLKVFAGGQDVFTTQLFFEPSFTTRVYTSAEPYLRHGDTPFTVANDIVIASSDGVTGILLNPVWNDPGPAVASAKIGLKFS